MTNLRKSGVAEQTYLGFSEPRAAAELSEDGVYRWRLERVAGPGSGTVNFIMLNPSTATAEQDDPTIRRCISFTRGWGYGRLVVTNLFAYRATDPRNLPVYVYEAIGTRNDYHLVRAAREADLVVAAWGNYGRLWSRSTAVRAYLSRLFCLGVTKLGEPLHPLYVPATKALQHLA